MTSEMEIALVRQNGCVLLPPYSHDRTCDIASYLAGRPQYVGQVWERDSRPWDGGPVSCWSLADVLTAPRLLERALALTGLVEDYLAAPPLMYSANAFTTRPAASTMPNIQELHRDHDDVRFLALFVLLSDVPTPADGAQELLSPSGDVVRFFGPAGTAWLADTRHLHRGVMPASRPRTLAWVRWGVSDPPPSYVGAGVSPLPRSVLGDRYPATQRLRDSIKLLVR